MNRRRYLAAVAGHLGLLSLPGCAGILPDGNDEAPSFPGGTLIIENTGTAARDVTVSVTEERFSASIDTTIAEEESVVEREFVTAAEGDVATLAARIGNDGEPTTFEFLPAGGEEDAPPEVARLAIQNSVEESATWTATAGANE